MTAIDSRCEAAHAEDQSPCEGSDDAVLVVDQAGGEALGCLRHGAALLASLEGGRVYPGTGSAIEVYRRAQALRPFEWAQ
jgi:hypothetical protein